MRLECCSCIITEPNSFLKVLLMANALWLFESLLLLHLSLGTCTTVDYNKLNGETPCDSIHVNGNDANVNNLSLPCYQCYLFMYNIYKAHHSRFNMFRNAI